MSENLEALFTFWWQRCAKEGDCDRAGSREHARVHRLWFAAGSPRNVASFIRRWANRPNHAGNPSSPGDG
jgi:hypothetical protein